jgi:CheY-like chemotaxis protein
MAMHCKHCSLEDRDGDWPKRGSLVDGRYRVESELGEGAMGLVYSARDVHLGRRVAIKVAMPGVAQTFTQEAAALGSIDHPNVVRLHAFGVTRNTPMYVMEHVEGRSLREILDDNAVTRALVPAHAALRIVAQIADGLAAVHAAGVVHNDLKPANVVVEAGTGRPVIVDFGLSIDALRRISVVQGSPAYMAPEASSPGGLVGPEADQYSLAATAFELLTGAPPFDAMSQLEFQRLHASAPRPKVSVHRPELAPLDPVLERAMAITATERYPTCVAFAAALREVLHTLPMPPAPRVDLARTGDLDVGEGLAVLVVDDDPIAARVAMRAVRLAFGTVPVRVTRAAAGAEAVEKASHELPRLVVLDFGLPDMDGVEVLSRIRELGRGEDVRVLVASGQLFEEPRHRFAVLGVQQFLPKPYDVTVVAERVRLIGCRAGWLPREGT